MGGDCDCQIGKKGPNGCQRTRAKEKRGGFFSLVRVLYTYVCFKEVPDVSGCCVSHTPAGRTENLLFDGRGSRVHNARHPIIARDERKEVPSGAGYPQMIFVCAPGKRGDDEMRGRTDPILYEESSQTIRCLREISSKSRCLTLTACPADSMSHINL